MTVCSIKSVGRPLSADFASLLSGLILLAGLMGAASPAAAAEDNPTLNPTLIVELVEGADAASVITRNGGIEVSQVPGSRLHLVSVPAEDLATALARYQADPLVERAELNQTHQTEGDPDPFSAYQWPLPRLGWDLVTLDLSASVSAAGSEGISAPSRAASDRDATDGLATEKADQSITLTTEVPATAGYASSFDVTATASSGLPVAITASGACAGSGTGSATIAMTSGTGICTVRYNQSGDADYDAAEATRDTTATKADQGITVTAAAPTTAAHASTFDVTATASSNLAVAITASGVCTGSGNGSATIAMTSGVGICTVHYNQAGDSNFQAATEVTEAVTADKAMLTVRPSPFTASRQYSDENPPFVPAYSGFAPGEGVGDLTEEPTCSTTAGPPSAPGSYPVTCVGGSASNYHFRYDDGATLAVTPEEALVEFSQDNPAAVKAMSRGKYRGKLSLKVLVKERRPDAAAHGAAAGDINAAALIVSLSPLLAGATVKLTCRATPVPVTGYDTGKTFTCTTAVDLGVDVYDLTAQVTGHYTGLGYDSIAVYGRGLGFANGGGWFYWPGTEDRTNFGFVMKTREGTDLQGGLLVVRHHADGTISRIKSSALTGLVVQNDRTTGCGNATFSGKASHTAWDSSANSGLGGYVSTGENPFMAYAEDCNQPERGLDHFLVRGVGDIQMPTDVSGKKVPLAADRGNIVVPGGGGKTK